MVTKHKKYIIHYSNEVGKIKDYETNNLLKALIKFTLLQRNHIHCNLIKWK